MAISLKPNRPYSGTAAEIAAFTPVATPGITLAQASDTGALYRWDPVALAWVSLSAGGSGPSGEDLVTADGGFTSGVYSDVLKTSIPLVSLAVPISAPSDGFILATFDASYLQQAGAGGNQYTFFRFMLDGVAVPASDTGLWLKAFGDIGSLGGMNARIAVTAGNHIITVQYLTGPVSGVQNASYSVLLAVPRSRIALGALFVTT